MQVLKQLLQVQKQLTQLQKSFFLQNFVKPKTPEVNASGVFIIETYK